MYYFGKTSIKTDESTDIDRLVLQKPTILKWTTEPPTVEGWYWAQTGKGISHIVKISRFGFGITGILWAYPTNDVKAHDLSDYDHWLGPLPIPEPPTESE